MLDYFFNHQCLGETTVTLYADNCMGQNINTTMMQYLIWRELTRLHYTITISFMVVSHTKFAPESCFGLLKRSLRKTEVSSPSDLEEVIHSSLVVNEYQLVGTQTGNIIIPVRDWEDFISLKFHWLIGIKKYYHFQFSISFPKDKLILYSTKND